MATWNQNDREESKPCWLNPSQKILCVRTNSGWEIPLHGTNLGNNFDGLKNYVGGGFGPTGITNQTLVTELIVAIPQNPTYNPHLTVTLTGAPSIFTTSFNGATGLSITAGTELFYYDQNSGAAPFTVGSTAGLEAICTVIGGTAVAGGFRLTLANFYDPQRNSAILGGPRDVELNGVFLDLNSSTTGSTASVLSIQGIDDSIFSANSLFANRITATGGLTFTSDTPNYRPYMTCPFNADSATTGGFYGLGLSAGTTANSTGAGVTAFGFYGVDGFGVSTLNFPGATAYIKVCANDANFTQNLSFAISTPNQFGAAAQILTGADLVNRQIPTAVYETFFGPTASVNNNIAILRINRAGATANQSYQTSILVTDNSAAGLTGYSRFTVSFGATASVS